MKMQKRHWWLRSHPPSGKRPATQACALTRNQTCDLFVQKPVLNPLSHTSQGSFVFLWCQLLLFLFHFWFYLLGFSLSFFVDESCYRFVNSVHFFKPALGFIYLLHCFLNSISLICTLIFLNSFILLTLGFVFSLLNYFKCKIYIDYLRVFLFFEIGL